MSFEDWYTKHVMDTFAHRPVFRTLEACTLWHGIGAVDHQRRFNIDYWYLVTVVGLRHHKSRIRRYNSGFVYEV